jgi:hypothetical protein
LSFLENRWKRFLFVFDTNIIHIHIYLYIIFILWHNFTLISGNLQYIHLLFFVQIVMGIPTSVSQTTPETSVAGLRNHLTSDLVPNRSVTRVGIPIVSSVTHISCWYGCV